MMETVSETSFGERVKEVIGMVGGAERLARLAGMPARAIGQYAAGTSDPTRSKVIALAAVAGINVLWLMTGEGPRIKGKPGPFIPIIACPVANPFEDNRLTDRLLTKTSAEHLPQAGNEARKLLHELSLHKAVLERQSAKLRRAREEADEVLERFGRLYDSAPFGHFTLDSEGIVRAANRAAAALLGRGHSRIIGRSFASFFVAEDVPSFVSFMGKVAAGKGKEVLEISLVLQQDSRPRVVQVKAIAGPCGAERRIDAIVI